MGRQDRQGVRTATDIERKYNFGQTFADVYGLIKDTQTAVEEANKAVDNLDHEEIFNRLTNYGKEEGIYRGDDGHIYINATYIKSGYINGDRIEAKSTINAPKINGGEVNINDNFVVDELGNVTLNGNISFGYGAINWGGFAPIKYQFSVDGVNDWHDVMTDADMFRRDCVGNAWGNPYQFRGKDGKDGEDGRDGSDGSDASVTYSNIKTALNRASKAALTFVTGSSVDTADIYARNIYGGNIYSGDDSGFYAHMDGESFGLYDDSVTNARALIDASMDQVRLILGVGSAANDSTAGRFFIQKGWDRTDIYLNSEDMGENYGFTIETDGTITAHAERLSGFYLTFS